MDDEFDIDIGEPSGDEEAAGEPEVAEEPSVEESAEEALAQAVGARKPGLISRWGAGINQFFSRITLPQWNLRTFLYVLVTLIVLWLLACNLPPVRINLFGSHIDAPKSAVFIINLILGAGLLRLCQVYAGRRAAREHNKEQSSPAS